MLEVFNGLVAAASPAEYIIEHPVLWSPAWQRVYASAIATDEQKGTLANLVRMTGVVGENPQRYPIGNGPVERIFGQVRRGEITQARALALAADPGLYSLLSPFYVRLLSLWAEAGARGKDWRTGASFQQLLLAALDARRGKMDIDQAEMDFIAVVHWLDIATRATWDVPDGVRFRDALRRGELLAATIDDPGGYYPPAEILNRLGILHLDPYISIRSNQNYGQQWRLWQERFDLERSKTMDGAATEEERIPPPEVALPKAADYLRRAARHRSGTDRGLTLKALLEALVWQRVAGLAPDAAEVEAVAKEALSLLPEEGYENPRTIIGNLLRWNARELGAPAAVDPAAVQEARRILQQPLDHWVTDRGPSRTVELFMQTARGVLRAEPALALQLWLAVAALVTDQNEQVRVAYYRLGQGVVRGALAPQPELADGQPLATRVSAVEAAAQDSYTRAAALFALGVTSGATNEEEAGAQLVVRAARCDEQFAERFQSLLLYTKAMLRHDAAVDALNQADLGNAVRLYMLAAYDLLSVELPLHALDALEKALDLTNDGNTKALEAAVAFIGEVAAGLERQLGDLVINRLQVAYRGLLARIARPDAPIKPILLLFLWEAAKGNAFSHALASGAPLPWLDTPEAHRREQAIEDLAGDVGPQPKTLLEESLLLTGYVSPREQQGGDAPGERLRNLQIAFDTEINRQLVARQAPARSWYPTDEALQAALEPATVLLSVFIGAAPDGRLAVFTLFATREDLGLTLGVSDELLAGNVIFGGDEDGRLASSLYGPLVEATRKALQDDPGPRCATGDALEYLQSQATNMLGGGLREKLDTFRKAGKNHLCICPNGPLHFYPYHLVGPEERPLAEDWAVTYLPNLRLLNPARNTAQPREGLIAIGLDFPPGNARGLPPLSGPEAEAREIAAVTGAACLTGTAVTEAAVVAALTRYRRIHIGTHGDLAVSAPSFQCLYLSPNASGDVLNAYEILRLDLTGVDLVTLSACETALGRFDLGDNPRGIPASLLIAGVSTIIGTLWPVETNTARTFFTSFYGQLKGDVGKGEAFHTAQSETRKQYPQYRDWGAFYLIGAVE